MGSVTDDDDLSPGKTQSPEDWYWDVLSWHHMMTNARSLTFGRGATVTASYMRRQARAAFLGALSREAPDITNDLITLELDRLSQCAFRIRLRWLDEINADISDAAAWQAAKETQQYHDLMRANQAVADYIGNWQNRHSLTEDWIWEAAYATARLAMDAGPRYGIPIPSPVPLILGDSDVYESPHIDKYSYEFDRAPRTFVFTPMHKIIDVPVYLDDLKYPPRQFEGIEQDDDGWLDTFDPRTEDVDAATDRLLETLRPRVRHALASIVAQDRELNGTQLPVTYRSPAAFEWLVQFQVL